MQRKTLEDLGLEKEVIDKIMAENGSDIEKVKQSAQTQIEDLTTSLSTATDTLKSFEGVDVKELQGKIAQLNADLQAKDSEYQTKLADMEFTTALDSAIGITGARNAKAVKALLDLDALKISKNQQEGIKKALETVRSENDYLFGSDEPIKNPVRDTGNSNVGADNSFMRSVMGLAPAETN